MVKKILYSTHRLLGTAISLLFLMWFITGLILIYHSFPDVDIQLKDKNREAISENLNSIDSLIQYIPTDEKIKRVELAQLAGQPIFTIETNKDIYNVDQKFNRVYEPISMPQLTNIASTWVNAPILKIDTLEKRDIWIMYTKYIKELPIYKVYFDDNKKHELYIASKSGEVLQFTSRSERIWAYLGSIPHKLYIPALREHTDTWIRTLTTLATICFIVSLSGIILGIRAYIKRYKNMRKWQSPYSKLAYKWHHILGLFFGIFLLTWAISGMMALQKVPQWLVKTEQKLPITYKLGAHAFDLNDFKLNYKDIFSGISDVKQITWNYFHDIPFYKVITGSDTHYINACTSQFSELSLSIEDITKAIKAIHGEDAQMKFDYLTEYDEYYLQWKRNLPLPVYLISVDSPDNNTYYISPESGYYKHVDDNRKARKWLFNGFHYLHIKWLMDRPVLWTIAIWTLSLGCIIVCSTGIWMGLRYIKRITRSKKKTRNICQKEK